MIDYVKNKESMSSVFILETIFFHCEVVVDINKEGNKRPQKK